MPTELTQQELTAGLDQLAQYLEKRDADRKGILLRDLVSSLYPPATGDGLDEVRRAVERLSDVPAGVMPESTVRIGMLIARQKAAGGGDGCRFVRVGTDTNGRALWTAGAPSAKGPAPAVAGAPARPPEATGPQPAPPKKRKVEPSPTDAPASPEPSRQADSTSAEMIARISVLARYLLERDPDHRGLRVPDLLSLLYPPQPKDGLDAVREAIRGFENSSLLGRLLRRFIQVPLEGGVRIQHLGRDRWTSRRTWAPVVSPPPAAPPIAPAPDEPWKPNPRRGSLSLGERIRYLAVLARHVEGLDPKGDGVTTRTILSSIYPARRRDGLSEVREAVEKITRTALGRLPEAAYLGTVITRNTRHGLPGGYCFHRVDVGNSSLRWKVSSHNRAPLATVPAIGALPQGPLPRALPKRGLTLDGDSPACRERVERAVGDWLMKHVCELKDAPPQLQVVSGTEITHQPFDLGGRSEPWVCIFYTRVTSGPEMWFRIPFKTWNAIGAAHKDDAPAFVAFCNDEPGMLTFDSYTRLAWATDVHRYEGEDILWPATWATYAANFKHVIPNLPTLIHTVTRAEAANADASATRFDKFERQLFENHTELAAALKRGWLLSDSHPSAGITPYWSRRCDRLRAIDLYVCRFKDARPAIPGSYQAVVRLDLAPAALFFTPIQLGATFAKIVPHLNSVEHLELGVERHLARPRTVLLQFRCSGHAAETIGQELFEAAMRLRPKHLALPR